MTTSLILLGLAAPAAPPPPPPLRLERGTELEYRGAVTEESARPGRRFRRDYDLECRAFVLDAADGLDVALLTVVKPQGEPGEPAVRLDRAVIDPRGRPG